MDVQDALDTQFHACCGRLSCISCQIISENIGTGEGAEKLIKNSERSIYQSQFDIENGLCSPTKKCPILINSSVVKEKKLYYISNCDHFLLCIKCYSQLIATLKIELQKCEDRLRNKVSNFVSKIIDESSEILPSRCRQIIREELLRHDSNRKKCSFKHLSAALCSGLCRKNDHENFISFSDIQEITSQKVQILSRWKPRSVFKTYDAPVLGIIKSLVDENDFSRNELFVYKCKCKTIQCNCFPKCLSKLDICRFQAQTNHSVSKSIKSHSKNVFFCIITNCNLSGKNFIRSKIKNLCLFYICTKLDATIDESLNLISE